jgi:Mg/Co/Ni transporter MgtE
MTADERLASAFLSTHPDVAARLLESMDPELASEVLASTPAAVAAPVLHHMLPTSSAQCAERLSESVIAALLEQLPSQAGAALVRHLPSAARDAVLKHVAPTRRAALTLLLRYPASAVGAWMEPRVLTLPEDCGIRDARERLERQEQIEPRIYVLDRSRRIQGAVRGLTLLRSSAKGRLTSLLEAADSLWAREAVAQAQGRDLWEQESEAPVVNRQGEFVGVISYANIRRGLRQADKPAVTVSGDREIGELAELFLSGLEETWISLNEILRMDRRSE